MKGKVAAAVHPTPRGNQRNACIQPKCRRNQGSSSTMTANWPAAFSTYSALQRSQQQRTAAQVPQSPIAQQPVSGRAMTHWDAKVPGHTGQGSQRRLTATPIAQQPVMGNAVTHWDAKVPGHKGKVRHFTNPLGSRADLHTPHLAPKATPLPPPIAKDRSRVTTSPTQVSLTRPMGAMQLITRGLPMDPPPNITNVITVKDQGHLSVILTVRSSTREPVTHP